MKALVITAIASFFALTVSAQTTGNTTKASATTTKTNVAATPAKTRPAKVATATSPAATTVAPATTNEQPASAASAPKATKATGTKRDNTVPAANTNKAVQTGPELKQAAPAATDKAAPRN